MVDEYQRCAGEHLLKEGVDKFWRGRILVIKIMEFSKGIEEDNIGVDLLSHFKKFILLLIPHEGDGEGFREVPPDVLCRGELVYSGYDSRGRRVQFYVEDPPFLYRKAIEGFPVPNGRRHGPGKGGLPKGRPRPKEGDALPNNIRVNEKRRLR